MPTSRRRFCSLMGLASAAHLTVAARSVDAGQAPPRPALGSRRDFAMDPDLVYLQTGSLGPSPTPVIDATIAAWRELERNPAYFAYGSHERHLERVRGVAAGFLGCQIDELVLTTSTTTGMNWMAEGLRLEAGDHVLITDQEHPGGRSGWEYVARTRGVVIDVVELPRDEQHLTSSVLARVEKSITPRTRVLSFSHVLSSTGLRLPVAELSALARSRGCLALVDGAQAVGGIAVDVKALGCHAYATSGHKWLLGPKGTGVLYLSAELGRTIDPVALQAGRHAYSASSGVCSLPSIHGFGAALEYLSAFGMAAVERHNLGLRARSYAALRGVPKVRAVGPADGPAVAQMLAYVLPASAPAGVLQERLRERHHVEVKVVPTQWFNGHRISTHCFNTDADVDALVAALRVELG